MALDDVFGAEFFRDAKLIPYKSALQRALNTIALRIEDPELFGDVVDLGQYLKRKLISLPLSAGLAFTHLLKELPERNFGQSDDKYLRALSDKLKDLLELTGQPELGVSEIYTPVITVLQQVSEPQRHHNIVSGMIKAAPELAKARGTPNFNEQLQALLTSLSNDKTKTPGKLTALLARYPPLSSLVIASGGAVPRISPTLETLLSKEHWRESYIYLLVKMPSLQYLTADRFAAYAADEQKLEFFTTYIGTSAREDRVRFYDSLHEQVPELRKLGKPLLDALFHKSKDSGLPDTYWAACATSVAMLIPNRNQRPPRWVSLLVKDINAAEPGQVKEIIAKEKAQQDARKNEAVMRKIYAKLVREIKKSAPVARGDYTTTDVLRTLDERLLGALQTYDGKKTPILEAMGKDLNQVNKTYFASGLPATLVVDMFAANTSHTQIRKTGQDLEALVKPLLHYLEASHERNILRWLFVRGFSMADFAYIDKIKARDDQDHRQLDIFDTAAALLDDPCAAFDKFTPEQRMNFSHLTGMRYLGLALQKVKPEQAALFDWFSQISSESILGVLDLPDKEIDFAKLEPYNDAFRVEHMTLESAKELGAMFLHATDAAVARKRADVFIKLEDYARDARDNYRYADIAKELAKASDAELNMYASIGDILVGDQRFSKIRIAWPAVTAIVKKTASLLDTYTSLADRMDSFMGHVRNYYKDVRIENVPDVDVNALLDGIAAVVVNASPSESAVLAVLGARASEFTCTTENLQSIKRIPDLEQKVHYIKELVKETDGYQNMKLIVQYATVAPVQALGNAVTLMKRPTGSFPEMLALARDNDLAQKVSGLQEGYRRTYLDFINHTHDPEQLKKLPDTHFYLAAQAYEFAKKNEMQTSFFSGFNENLQRGSVDKWAKAIIDYFRGDAKGGALYRVRRSAS